MPHRSINPAGESQRAMLRLFGLLLLVGGGVFTAIGLISFFSAFGGGGTPSSFWCAFVGLPMLGIGMMLLKAGYMGAITRYVAGETLPVATDSLNYVAHEGRDAIREVVGAIREGVRGEATAASARCAGCGHDNDAGARFCDQCGTPMARERECPKCHHRNDGDARFCSGCGAPMSAAR